MLRCRGETAEKVAGLVEAARAMATVQATVPLGLLALGGGWIGGRRGGRAVRLAGRG